jgi:hypothetical protein
MQFTLDPKPTENPLVDQHHSQRSPNLELHRRHLLKLGFATVVAASLPGRQLHAQSTPEPCAPPIPQNHAASNGGSCPYPIPWLDKNGNHNQSPAPNVELSNIFHFKGKLARCNGFHGMGYGQQRQPLCLGKSDDRLQLYGRRILGRTTGPAGDIHPHVTYGIQGTGGPCEPVPRLSFTHLT